MSSPFYLFRTRRFAPLFGTQFFGAFNDNLFKNTLAIILTFHSSQWTSLPVTLLAPLIGAIFILPFFLFSGISGELADRLDKAELSRIIKIWELLLMILALGGFYFHSFALLLGVIFGLGLHSTVFGPIKYAIIPQHVQGNELISANALIESGTFVAILLGTILGGLISSLDGGGMLASLAGILFAVIGYLFSRSIPSAPAYPTSVPFTLNFFSHTAKAIALVYRDRLLFLSILAISWFWLYGALFLTQFPGLVKMVFLGDEHTVTLLLLVFTIGIGAGSMICERLSAHRIRPLLIVVGAVGMALFGIDFAHNSIHFIPTHIIYQDHSFWHICLDLMLIGAFGGLYSVPLYALLQEKSDPAYRSRVIAANNIFNALFMVIGSLGVMALLSNGYTIPETFWYTGLATALIAVGVAWRIKRITA